MAQAVMLPPPEMSNFYKQQELLTHPDLKKLTVLDTAITNVLALSNISSHRKVELYDEALTRFRNVRENVMRDNEAIPIPMENTPEQPQIVTAEDSSAGSTTLQEIHSLLKAMSNSKKPLKTPASTRKSTSKKISTPKPPTASTNNQEIDATTSSASGTKLATPTKKPKKSLGPVTRIEAINSAPSRFNTHEDDLTEAGKKLEKLLATHTGIKTMLERRNINGATVKQHILNKALNYMANPGSDFPTNIPDEVLDLSGKIYNEMLTHSVVIPRELKKNVIFKGIELQHANKPVAKRSSRNQGSVDFNEWDNNTKKPKSNV